MYIVASYKLRYLTNETTPPHSTGALSGTRQGRVPFYCPCPRGWPIGGGGTEKKKRQTGYGKRALTRYDGPPILSMAPKNPAQWPPRRGLAVLGMAL